MNRKPWQKPIVEALSKLEFKGILFFSPRRRSEPSRLIAQIQVQKSQPYELPTPRKKARKRAIKKTR